MSQIIVVGGGLAGLSAAHTILEHGGSVCLIEKNAFCGGNSTKATSGINGSLTRIQIRKKIPDTPDAFLRDTALSASKGASDKPSDLNRVLVYESAESVHQLMDRFKLDLSLIGRMGGASFPRTHRGPERFPGMVITYGLMKYYDALTKQFPKRCRLLVKSRVTSLIIDRQSKSENRRVIGVEYTDSSSNLAKKEFGPVIIATGGFGADFSSSGILASVRKDLLHLPTTNGDHCTGDGLKMAFEIGAGNIDLEQVQVHPTGLVNPSDPNSKVKFLAAEALRGCGGILLDGRGRRFCDELGRRDYVTGEMTKLIKKGLQPFRLVLNSLMSSEFDQHCKHYYGRGLMKFFNNGNELAEEIGISALELQKTFDDYNSIADKRTKDPFGKKFFPNTPFRLNDTFYVAIVTPVIHYCMGGLTIDKNSNVIDKEQRSIEGLFAAGEVAGGVHGLNRLGGSSLTDCVVFGRVSARSATKYLLENLCQKPTGLSSNERRVGPTSKFTVSIDSSKRRLSIDQGDSDNTNVKENIETAISNEKEDKVVKKDEIFIQKEEKEFSLEEVSKHSKPDDCQVVVNKQVLNVTKFLKDHPGGEKAILLYAGRDASEEFNMLHEADVVQKYAPQTVVGQLKGTLNKEGGNNDKARSKL